MPAAYARAFATADVAEHAWIVNRRGAALAHAELCGSGSESLVCVVADDRPGLLALVTDALLVQGFGIQSAPAYCRRRADGTTERVDFLELHHSARGGATEGFEASELESFLQTLTELISEDIRASARPSAAPVRSVPPARAYFELEALRRDECWSRRRTHRGCYTPLLARSTPKACASSLVKSRPKPVKPATASS